MTDREKKSPSRIDSFRNAFRGCWNLIKYERNTRIHAVITLLVLGVGIWLELSFHDWGYLVIVIGMVWLTEALNTAIEAISDSTISEYHPLIRIGKDASAAAVLISAFTALVIGGLILGPALWSRIFGR